MEQAVSTGWLWQGGQTLTLWAVVYSDWCWRSVSDSKPPPPKEGSSRGADTAVPERRRPNCWNRGDETISSGKLSNMWNQAIPEDITFEGRCERPHFEVSSEQQRGMCWRQALKCKNCRYEGGMHNLYAEVLSTSRGPKVSNLGWHVGLQETTTGVSKSRLLLTGAYISPPGKSAITTCAVRVADATSDVVEESLKQEWEDSERRTGPGGCLKMQASTF